MGVIGHNLCLESQEEEGWKLPEQYEVVDVSLSP